MRTDTKMHAGLAVGIASVLAAGGQVAFAANGPGGSPTPANKAIAAGSKLAVFSPTQGAVPLLQATLRTSKPTDLMIHTSLECSILTKLTTGPDEALTTPPTAAASDTARANASIRGFIEVDDDAFALGSGAEGSGTEATETGAAPRIVPITSTSQPPQDGSDPNSGTVTPGADEGEPIPDDAATYCQREYERTVVDRENPLDGIDQETDYIDTKTANAFNWVLLNAGSGVHFVRLMGQITGGTATSCPEDSTQPAVNNDVANNEGTACTSAFVGNRTMIIEPTKMANDAVISPTASS